MFVVLLKLGPYYSVLEENVFGSPLRWPQSSQAGQSSMLNSAQHHTALISKFQVDPELFSLLPPPLVLCFS